jgi:hypothetical protein
LVPLAISVAFIVTTAGIHDLRAALIGFGVGK